MKRLILMLLTLSALLPATAQKGMMGIGADVKVFVPWGDDLSDTDMMGTDVVPGLNLKYQYYVLNYYRVQPYVGIGYVKMDLSHRECIPNSLETSRMMFEIAVDNHIFFTRPGRFRGYAVAGIGYASVPLFDVSEKPFKNYETGKEEMEKKIDPSNDSNLLLNFGAGLDVRITDKLSLQVEFGVPLFPSMREGSYSSRYLQYGLQGKAGLTYNF